MPRITLTITALLACSLFAADCSAATPEEQFEALRLRYNAELEKVWAEAENGKPQEERARIYRERHPANTMYDEFLRLEEQNRGTLIGFSTLHHLITAAYPGYGGNPDVAATVGGQQALRILAAHYADHPDLDVILSEISNANEAKALLRRAME